MENSSKGSKEDNKRRRGNRGSKEDSKRRRENRGRKKGKQGNRRKNQRGGRKVTQHSIIHSLSSVPTKIYKVSIYRNNKTYKKMGLGQSKDTTSQKISTSPKEVDVLIMNPLMFVFAIVGNATYIASILVSSLKWSKIRPNLPWLVDSGGCVLLDTIIMIQLICYRYRSSRDVDKKYSSNGQ